MSGRGKGKAKNKSPKSPEAKAITELCQILEHARDEFDNLEEDKQSKYKMPWKAAMQRFVDTHYPWFKLIINNPAMYAKFLRLLKDKEYGFTGAVLAFAAMGNLDEKPEDDKELEDVSPQQVNKMKDELPRMYEFDKILRKNPPPQSA